MHSLLSEFITNVHLLDEEDSTSLLIQIANSTETTLTFLDIETASSLLSIILQKRFNRSFPYFEILTSVHTDNFIIFNEHKVFIADKKLFLVILLNSIRKYDQSIRANNSSLQISEGIITEILNCLNVEKRCTALLLKTLQYVLTQQCSISSSLNDDIIYAMKKVALSPLEGFKSYAHNISKKVISFLNNQAKDMHIVHPLPIVGIDSADLVKLYSEQYIMDNKDDLVQRICFLYENNITNKDGEILHQRILQFFSFEKWKEDIWPLFLPFLHHIDKSGEFLQSLLKYWISSTVKNYKLHFYLFLKSQKIDKIIKLHTLLETRRSGFLLEDITIDNTYDITTTIVGLKIHSTYYKKSLCPKQYECNILLDFLYGNINYFLDNQMIKCFKMFISQFFLFSHNDLKKTVTNLSTYSEFLNKLYKFCYGCLCSSLFEVGVQVLQIILDISVGSHKSLCLLYKLEKQDFYEEKENLLYKKMKEENLWMFEDVLLISKIKICFTKNKGTSKVLTDLIASHYPIHFFMDIEIMKENMHSAKREATLQSCDRIPNLAMLFFNNTNDLGLHIYVNELFRDVIIALNGEKVITSGIHLHQCTLGIITLRIALEHDLVINNFSVIIFKSLKTFLKILENISLIRSTFGSIKLAESFINNVILCLNRHLDLLWPDIDKEFTVESIIAIIETSNMKRPVSLSADLLKKLSHKMELQEEDKNLKIKNVERTLCKLLIKQENKNFKIRRNPEMRLVLHAMCLHERSDDKPILQWVISFLMDVLVDSKSEDSCLTAALNCTEILLSDNTLHESTLKYIPNIVQICVETFVKSSWMVRNANLQLAKALIERLYGISLGLYNRPKNISDLLLLYPQFYEYFLNILISRNLDERAHMVFQFFLESQVKVHSLPKDAGCLLGFQDAFLNIIENYENHYGKLAVKSFVALCAVNDIPNRICYGKEYIKTNYINLKKNVLTNFMILLRELFYKYRTFFRYTGTTKQLQKVEEDLKDLVYFLRPVKGIFFDFTLFKISSIESILYKMRFLDCERCFQDRIWLHNNLSNVLLNTNSCDLSKVCRTILSYKIPEFAQTKIMSILVFRYEKQHFQPVDIKNILEVLFQFIHQNGNHSNFILRSYLKVVILLTHNVLKLNLNLSIPALSDNLFRNLIFVVYKAQSTSNSIIDMGIIQKQLIQSLALTEDIDIDICSVLMYLKKISPEDSNFNFCKLIFYFLTNDSTYLDSFYAVSSFLHVKFTNILSLLKFFFHYEHLRLLLDESEISKLYEELIKNLDKYAIQNDSKDTFYQIEGDNVISQDTLKKLLKECKKIEIVDQ